MVKKTKVAPNSTPARTWLETYEAWKAASKAGDFVQTTAAVWAMMTHPRAVRAVLIVSGVVLLMTVIAWRQWLS